MSFLSPLFSFFRGPYISFWDATQQREVYASAWGMRTGDEPNDTTPVAVINEDADVMVQGMPYIVSPDAEGVVTWVGELPPKAVFEFKKVELGSGLYSAENYIVLPLNTEIKTAKELCVELIGEGIMTGSNIITKWDALKQKEINLPKCDNLELVPDDYPLIQILPGVPYLITVSDSGSWSQK